MQPSQPFAGELAATAHALRQLREQVRFLIDHNDPRAFGHPDAWLVLARAAQLATALESLARRFGVQEV